MKNLYNYMQLQIRIQKVTVLSKKKIKIQNLIKYITAYYKQYCYICWFLFNVKWNYVTNTAKTISKTFESD